VPSVAVVHLLLRCVAAIGPQETATVLLGATA
jgi:hypothetical protein